MRNLLKSLIVAALVAPLSALAAGTIVSSRHNLSSTGAYSVTSTQTQICVFCHTPHRAAATKLLWNRTSTSAAGWTAGNTTSGTGLPAASALSAPSKNCLSCHDGTQSLGAVVNYQGAAASFTMSGAAVAATGFLNATAYQVGAGGNMDTNHPVSIPYKGSLYNAINSSIAAADANYRNASTTGCTGSTVCTTGGTYAVRLYGSTTTTAGIECGSCHEPHDTTNTSFLRYSNASSSLCQSCHNK